MKNLLIIATFLFLISCKKKKDTLAPSDTNITTVANPIDSIPVNTLGNKKFVYTIANLDTTKTYDFSMVFAECNFSQYVNIRNENGIRLDYYVGVAGILDGAGKPAKKGRMWINDSLASFTSDQTYYNSWVRMHHGDQFRWKLEGDVGFPVQEFDMPISLPNKISFHTILPDTVNSAQSFLLEITEPIAQADSISFSIYAQENGVMSGRVIDYFTKATGKTSHSFSTNDLSYIKSLKGEAYVSISGYRYLYGMLGARKVLYVTQRTAYKQIFVK